MVEEKSVICDVCESESVVVTKLGWSLLNFNEAHKYQEVSGLKFGALCESCFKNFENTMEQAVNKIKVGDKVVSKGVSEELVLLKAELKTLKETSVFKSLYSETPDKSELVKDSGSILENI